MKIHRIALLMVWIAGSAEAIGECVAPGALELSALDGTNGFVLNGVEEDDFSAASVSGAGDVNGDGFDDLIIGATGASPNGNNNAGACYVVFGGAGVGATGVIELASLDGTNGFVLNGVGESDFSGGAVSGAGDINDDGFDDLIVGASQNDANGNTRAGTTYVVFGGATVGSSGSLDLAVLDGSDGFVMNGIDPHDGSGGAVSSAGDVNNDGVCDLIIGATAASPGGRAFAGESYVIFGGPGIGASGVIELSSLDGSNGFVLNGVDPDDISGGWVASAGDVNSDGVVDLIIAAIGVGETYVVFGGAGVGASGVIELSSLNGANGFVLIGSAGGPASPAGDVNDDGVDDLILGVSSADPNGVLQAGESYVVFGGAGVGASGVIELSSLDGSDGFILNGIDQSDTSGSSVSSAGDVNGDGVGDLIIAAPNGSPGGAADAGESYVVYGGADVGSSGTLELASLNGANGFVLNGVDAGDRSGARGATGVGDVNQDGYDDLLIAAPRADPGGRENAGESYVIFGGEASPPAPADFNADGCIDSADLAALLAAWDGPGADLDGDGVTDGADLAILLAAWSAH